VIDSAVDLTSSIILFWAWHAIKKRDKYRYPQGNIKCLYVLIRMCTSCSFAYVRLGRTRLEPVAIIILSVIMCAASVLVIYESINTISHNAQYFTETNTTKTLNEIDMSAFPISIMIVTIISKSILFALCCRIKTPTMSALSSDHRNDVFSNIVALTCGLLGKNKRFRL
jgi:divalent metal cation (Fe/Co/Zn/Cd) transporter